MLVLPSKPRLSLPERYARQRRIPFSTRAHWGMQRFLREDLGMLWVPQKGLLRCEHNVGDVGSVSLGAFVTSGASASTKGTPVEVFASTAFDSYWMVVGTSGWGVAATASQTAYDVLIGAATESILIANILGGYAGNWGAANSGIGTRLAAFPIYIPAGSRIAIQVASARTSTGNRFQMWLYGGNGYPPFRVGSRVTTYGMGTVPNGTTITPGASGAQGSWTQIVASSSEAHFAFIPSFQPTGDTTTNLRELSVGIGIGSATEELLQTWHCATDGNEMMSSLFPVMPVFADVPASTRLAMRASNSGTNDGGYNGVIHAMS